ARRTEMSAAMTLLRLFRPALLVLALLPAGAMTHQPTSAT
ncbi:hypothetical protein SAMN04487993_10641, partial [Salipiger marinus]